MDLKTGVAQLVNPVLRVWNDIGHDVEAAYRDTGEALDNGGALEMCLDADRLLLTGNDAAAHKLCIDLCMEHGFNAVVQELGLQVTLA